jgi:hypothetical protein
MLDNVVNWLRSELNIFYVLGCVFDIMQSPAQAEMHSITVDFELNGYLCRLIFWETGNGHIEVIEIENEKTFIDEIFDIKTEFAKAKPFNELAVRLST